jgi:hypothetical protein
MNAIHTIPDGLPERPVLRRGLVGPAVLIGLGLVFLANNLGWLGWDVWGTLWRLWPVLLIAVGLDLLIGRRSILGSALIVVVVLGVVGAAVWWSGTLRTSGVPVTGQAITQSLDGATRADVEIGMGAGTLRLRALNESNGLIDGTVQQGPRDQLFRSFTVDGDTAIFKLQSRSPAALIFPAPNTRFDQMTWDMRLNQSVPMHLKVSTGAGTATLDLARLHITDLEVNIGVGTTTLTMPAQGHVQAQINGGVGETTIIIPAGMAARITASAGLGTVQAPSSYQHQDKVYRSPGYDSAVNRVDLQVNGGVGSIVIQQGGE